MAMFQGSPPLRDMRALGHHLHDIKHDHVLIVIHGDLCARRGGESVSFRGCGWKPTEAS
jgi:hypothetical protein